MKWRAEAEEAEIDGTCLLAPRFCGTKVVAISIGVCEAEHVGGVKPLPPERRIR